MDGLRGRAAQTLWAWGANSYGQLGLGHKQDVLVPQALKEFTCNQKTLRNIAGGGGHSAVITDKGELFVCGQNKNGQLGLHHTEDVMHFTLCSSLSGCPVVQVACGWDFTIILAGNGHVLSCGSNTFGQLGVPHTLRGCCVPQKIECLKDNVVNVAAGLRHALAATENGSVFQWGTGMVSHAKRACQGKTIPSFLRAKEPCKVTGIENIQVKNVTSGSYHAASLTAEGELYVWGSNKYKQLVSTDDFLLEPQKIDTHYFLGEKVRRVWNGWTHMVAQTDCWFSKTVCGSRCLAILYTWPNQRNLHCLNRSSIIESGTTFSWGRGDYGQLGRNGILCDGQRQDEKGSTEQFLKVPLAAPVAVPSLTGASEIACGSEHNLAVVGGQCFSWGWNEHGMCGNGTEENICSPQPVRTLSSEKLLLIGCGAGHSMACCYFVG